MKDEALSVNEVKNLGWSVAFAGMGINLALGILYTWSVIGKAIPAEWGWTETHRSLPYSIACLVFSLIMVPAGRMQDKLTPAITAKIGGVLVGLGMIAASFTTSPIGYMLGFGLLAGAGIGFGYAAATPPAVKWFPAAKTGTIAGIVVSGFGLAAVYAAPLTQTMIAKLGVSRTMLVWGVAFFALIVGLKSVWQIVYNGLAGFLVPPPTDYKAATIVKSTVKAPSTRSTGDFVPAEMLRTWQFYLLWFLYACGAGAGLMIIAKLATIADKQAGIKLGFILVASLAVGNGGGRVVAGMLSDKIGRKATLFLCFCLQAALILVLSLVKEGSFLADVRLLGVISALIGANYGANLALFPAMTKDYFGLKNFGMNYGLVFTSWGVGGFMLSLLAGKVYDATKSFNFSYYAAIGLLVLAALATFALKPPKHENA
jgi:MFS transporter, OFA family, oxalate/formate antiporter